MEKRIEQKVTPSTGLRAGERNGEEEERKRRGRVAHPGAPGLRSTTDLLYSRLYEMGETLPYGRATDSRTPRMRE